MPQALEARVIYEIPGMENVTHRSIRYSSDQQIPLTMDIYYPLHLPVRSQLPVVIFVLGYPDSVVCERFGGKLKDSGQYVSWAQLAAASGIIAITYETNEPEQDFYSVLVYVRKNADTLQMDGARIGLWACSANVANALAILADASTELRCAVLYYGFMFDRNGSHEMEILARQVGSAYPCRAKSVGHLSLGVPLFVVRTGIDNPQLNRSIDDFVHEAAQRNLPLTFVNYSDGEHGFDIKNDTRTARKIIRNTLEFLHDHLIESL